MVQTRTQRKAALYHKRRRSQLKLDLQINQAAIRQQRLEFRRQRRKSTLDLNRVKLEGIHARRKLCRGDPYSATTDVLRCITRTDKLKSEDIMERLETAKFNTRTPRDHINVACRMMEEMRRTCFDRELCMVCGIMQPNGDCHEVPAGDDILEPLSVVHSSTESSLFSNVALKSTSGSNSMEYRYALSYESAGKSSVNVCPECYNMLANGKIIPPK